jgi:hypothetical protein
MKWGYLKYLDLCLPYGECLGEVNKITSTLR